MSCEKDCVRDCAKVVLPKNVADAIKEMRDNGVNDCGIVYYVMSDPGSSDLTDSIKEIERWVFKYGEGGSPDLLMSAIVNGYVVEATSEDKLREYLRRNEIEPASVPVSSNTVYKMIGRRQGVWDTLDILGITVEGVNG